MAAKILGTSGTDRFLVAERKIDLDDPMEPVVIVDRKRETATRVRFGNALRFGSGWNEPSGKLPTARSLLRKLDIDDQTV